MQNNKLAFKRPACKKVHELNALNMNEDKSIRISGVDWGIEWSEFMMEVPNLNERHWKRSSIIPKVGSYRSILVSHPFNMSIGDKIWTLFQPALSLFNGWDDHPEEINNSAMVKFCFESIISQNEKEAWIVIRIEDVLLLKEADIRLQLRESPGIMNNFDCYNSTHIFTYEEWLYIDSCSQGDIGIMGTIKEESQSLQFDIGRLLGF
ncbi:hypothetical protein [Paenibacillus brasilensis]|uniref:Uncharacterized protein n=1 Tax=Paenibacillus brasilensis TaxID=128574 RepID=A0ABU0L6C1_9BACL|nr:hypothetical protein [Paenibacillus brasilensis]MDQ0496809.1 hypothetical protein [Paenibacillus brasilensis]